MQRKNKRNNSKPPIWRGPRGCTKRALFRVWISPSQPGTLTLAEEEEAKALSGTDALSYVGLAHSTLGGNWGFRIEALVRAWNRSGFGRRVGSRPLRSGGGRMRNFGRLSVCRLNCFKLCRANTAINARSTSTPGCGPCDVGFVRLWKTTSAFSAPRWLGNGKGRQRQSAKGTKGLVGGRPRLDEWAAGLVLRTGSTSRTGQAGDEDT
jgi:hypothetical protein